MKEEIIYLGNENSKVGIITHNSEKSLNSGICTIFLNAGFIHKVGPNRLYVETARKLAEKGVVSLRFDYNGLGDSDAQVEDRSLKDLRTLEIKQAIDKVRSRTNIENYILIGLCSSAEDAFRASFSLNEVKGMFLIDGIYSGRTLLEDIFPIAKRNSLIRYYKKNLLSFSRWKKLLRGKSNVLNKKNLTFLINLINRRINRLFYIKRKKRNNSESKVGSGNTYGFEDWEKLFHRNIKIKLVFCEGSHTIDIFRLTLAEKLKTHSSLIDIELVKDVDHTFTPQWSQHLITSLITDWIQKNQIQN